MSSSKVLLSSVLAAGLCLSACEPPPVAPELSITASPRTLDGNQQVATITVEAFDAKGKAGTGSVTLDSTAGSLKAGTELQLAGGKATTDFTCNRAMDPACTGTVRITGVWTVGGEEVPGTVSINITPAMMVGDGGLDAGARLDGGAFDGGFSGDYTISLNTSKTNLIAGATDSTEVAVGLFTNTTQMLPIADTVTLTLTNGASFNANTAQSTTTVQTSATTGTANVNVFSGTARGDFQLVAAARDAQRVLDLRALNVMSIVQKPDPATVTQLNVQSTGIATSTQVVFEVRDNAGLPLPGVTVSFELTTGSAAGCSVAPTQAVSDQAGLVRTTLLTGESQGTASVKATVMGLTPATSNSFIIAIGRPSAEKLLVSCVRKTLGALQDPQPPRRDQSTQCSASFADRNSVKPAYPLLVSWLAEAGQVDVNSMAAAGAGIATTSFATNADLPRATTPLVGEPSNGSANPRDGFVTIVASMPGEEQFWDGTGGGLQNGKWEPGEWFVDLPEPYVDSNDNGQYDNGEPFTDTDRVDCTTKARLPKNNMWDGPNGCWDSNTQIWAPTHIVYSDSLVGGAQNTTYVQVTPPFPTTPVPPGDTSSHLVRMWDSNFNRLSSDAIGASVLVLSGTRGAAGITIGPNGGEDFGGHTITYGLMSATETSPGVFVRNGPCDTTVPDAGYPATRCLKETVFGPWGGGTTVRVGITAPAAQAPLADGGVAPPTTTSFQLRVGNALQASPSVVPFSVTFE